jgi:hypothetical protein
MTYEPPPLSQTLNLPHFHRHSHKGDTCELGGHHARIDTPSLYRHV